MPNFSVPPWPKTLEEFIAQNSPEDLENPPISPATIAALKNMFLAPKVSVSETAQIIGDEIIKYEEAIQTSGTPNSLWGTMVHAIEELPYTDEMVQLFVELAKIPKYGEGYGGEGDFLNRYWELWAEMCNGFDDPISTDPDREAKRQGWINFNTFNAGISRHRQEFPRLDQRERVQWITCILEERPWEQVYDRAKYVEEWNDERYLLWQKEAHDVRTLDGYVPAAAVWFITDTQAIYELKGDIGYERYKFNKTDWHKQGGKDGSSRERFIYWRKRFEWISGVEELEKRTKLAAKEAAEAMKRVEENNKDRLSQ